jgi:hypothetical protein
VSLETQLKNLVTSQLKEAREGIEKLNQAMKILAKIKKGYAQLLKYTVVLRY